MSRFTSWFPVFDATIIHRVAAKNRQKNAIFCTFSFATQRILLASQIGIGEVNLRIKLHFSYIDQFVVQPIFKYLIGTRGVEVCMVTLSSNRNRGRRHSFGYVAIVTASDGE